MTEDKPSPPAKPMFSGMTQIVVASIGAIGTVSGALIAANWGHRGPTPGPTPTPSVIAEPVVDWFRGDWHAANGAVLRIEQDAGGALRLLGQIPFQGDVITLQGVGHANGQQMQFAFRRSDGDAGQCSGQIVTDSAHLQVGCTHENGTAENYVLNR